MRAIYRGLKQVFETLFSGQGSSFRRVGLVEFPSPGMWSIVLISQAPSVEIANALPGEEEHISVFLPCAPNPTTGFFFYVPKSKIIEVDMSAEDAATLIMSAGVVQPGIGSAKEDRGTGRDRQRRADREYRAAAAGEGRSGVDHRSLHVIASDEAIHSFLFTATMDCFAALAMTCDGTYPAPINGIASSRSYRYSKHRSASPRSPFSFGLSCRMRNASSRACVTNCPCTSERAMR